MQFDNMKNNQIETKSFLRKVAEDVCKMPKEQLIDLILIFTNRRAIKYFKEEYKSMQEGVFIMPECETINDFVQSYSPYKQAEELSLIYMLYCSYQKIYYSHNPLSEGEEAESFENFYFWGKTILNDFDDIDKNLADARKLYTTLSEEKEIEELFDFLSEEQKNILSQYFADFKKLYSSDSKLKNNFVKIWNCLSDIYFDYKEELKKNSIAYSGMIYRDLVERMSESDNLFGDDIFAFAGFNVLNQSEKKLFECKMTATAANESSKADIGPEGIIPKIAFKRLVYLCVKTSASFHATKHFPKTIFRKLRNQIVIIILSLQHTKRHKFII